MEVSFPRCFRKSTILTCKIVLYSHDWVIPPQATESSLWPVFCQVKEILHPGCFGAPVCRCACQYKHECAHSNPGIGCEFMGREFCTNKMTVTYACHLGSCAGQGGGWMSVLSPDGLQSYSCWNFKDLFLCWQLQTELLQMTCHPSQNLLNPHCVRI